MKLKELERILESIGSLFLADYMVYSALVHGHTSVNGFCRFEKRIWFKEGYQDHLERIALSHRLRKGR